MQRISESAHLQNVSLDNRELVMVATFVTFHHQEHSETSTAIGITSKLQFHAPVTVSLSVHCSVVCLFTFQLKMVPN